MPLCGLDVLVHVLTRARQCSSYSAFETPAAQPLAHPALLTAPSLNPCIRACHCTNQTLRSPVTLRCSVAGRHQRQCRLNQLNTHTQVSYYAHASHDILKTLLYMIGIFVLRTFHFHMLNILVYDRKRELAPFQSSHGLLSGHRTICVRVLYRQC